MRTLRNENNGGRDAAMAALVYKEVFVESTVL